MIIITDERVRRIMSTPYRRSWAIGDTVIAFRIRGMGYGEWKLDSPLRNTIVSTQYEYEYNNNYRINRLAHEKQRDESSHFDLHVVLGDGLMYASQYLFAIKVEDMTAEEAAYVVTQRLQGEMR